MSMDPQKHASMHAQHPRLTELLADNFEAPLFDIDARKLADERHGIVF